MSFVVNSANMNLPVPIVGVDPGPQYAIDVNSCLTLIDQHDHTPGYGVQITPAGIDINTNLTFGQNFATDVAGVVLTTQLSTPTVNTIYESGVDLFFVDGDGNDVRITQNGAVAGTPGSIANLAAPASASYVAADSTFVWESDTNIAANMDFGAAIMRNISPNSTFALTLQPPAALSSDYSLTLPIIPVSRSLLTIDTSGIIAPMSGFPNVGSNGQIFTASSGSTDGVLWSNTTEPLNYAVGCSVAANALTVNLLTAGGSTPSTASPVIIPFRSASLTNGQMSPLLITSALSIVIPSGATLGHKASAIQYIWVYVLNNAGTPQLGVSGINGFDDLSRQSATAITTGADLGNVLYATGSATNNPTRLIARLKITETVPGTWATLPSEVAIDPDKSGILPGQLASTVDGTALSVASFSSTSVTFVTVGTFATAANPPVGRPVVINSTAIAASDSFLRFSIVNSAVSHRAIFQICRTSDNKIITQAGFGEENDEGHARLIYSDVSILGCIDPSSDGTSQYYLQLKNTPTASNTVAIQNLLLTATVI